MVLAIDIVMHHLLCNNRKMFLVLHQVQNLWIVEPCLTSTSNQEIPACARTIASCLSLVIFYSSFNISRIGFTTTSGSFSGKIQLLMFATVPIVYDAEIFDSELG